MFEGFNQNITQRMRLYQGHADSNQLTVMRLSLLFFLILSFSAVYSQRSFSAIAKPRAVTIKFCPLAMADDVSFPTIQIGIEYRFSEKISWYNEFGIKYRKSYYEKTDTSFISSRGFKAKTEVRYYIKKRNRKAWGFYGGINGFFTRDYHNTQIHYHHNNDTTLMTDVFAVKKDVFGGNFVFGFQRNLSKKVGVDVYGGLGIRFRNVIPYNQEYNRNTDNYIYGRDMQISNFRQQTDVNGGFSTTLNITWGVRLCYKF